MLLSYLSLREHGNEISGALRSNSDEKGLQPEQMRNIDIKRVFLSASYAMRTLTNGRNIRSITKSCMHVGGVTPAPDDWISPQLVLRHDDAVVSTIFLASTVYWEFIFIFSLYFVALGLRRTGIYVWERQLPCCVLYLRT